MTIQARDISHTDTEEMPGNPAHVDAHGHFYKIYVNFPKSFNLLSPNSDKHLISYHNVTTWWNIEVIKKEMIKKNNNYCSIRFSQLVP